MDSYSPGRQNTKPGGNVSGYLESCTQVCSWRLKDSRCSRMWGANTSTHLLLKKRKIFIISPEVGWLQDKMLICVLGIYLSAHLFSGEPTSWLQDRGCDAGPHIHARPHPATQGTTASCVSVFFCFVLIKVFQFFSRPALTPLWSELYHTTHDINQVLARRTELLWLVSTSGDLLRWFRWRAIFFSFKDGYRHLKTSLGVC